MPEAVTRGAGGQGATPEPASEYSEFVYCVNKITVLLVRSDISAGNSLSVPQLTAVRCHYPVFLLTRLPFLKQVCAAEMAVRYAALSVSL